MISSTLLRPLLYLLSIAVLLLALLSVRLLLVLRRQHSPSRSPSEPRPRDAPSSLAIFLGSGGHSAEMMRLIAHLDWNRFSTRTWIISSGDNLSESKALAFEQTIGTGQFKILRIPRARTVHQSYLTSPFSTLYSLSFCLYFITVSPYLPGRSGKFADLILLNGPGSCVPIAFAAFLPRLFFRKSSSPKLVYIESLARTRQLSLSAKLVRPIVDRFFVQWDSLRDDLKQKEERIGRGARLKAKVECQGWLM